MGDSGGRGKRSKSGLKRSLQEAAQSSSSSSSSSSDEEGKQTIKKKVREKGTAKVPRVKAASNKQKVIQNKKPQGQAAGKNVGEIHRQSSSSDDSDSSEDEVDSQPTASEKKRAATAAAKKQTAPKEVTKKRTKVSATEPKTTVKVRKGEGAVLSGFAVMIPRFLKVFKY